MYALSISLIVWAFFALRSWWDRLPESAAVVGVGVALASYLLVVFSGGSGTWLTLRVPSGRRLLEILVVIVGLSLAL